LALMGAITSPALRLEKRKASPERRDLRRDQ